MRIMRTVFWGILIFGLCLAKQADAVILINEILADPPTGIEGDANQDAVGSSTQDEFIEVFNAGQTSLDLSGWFIRDNVRIRHSFAQNFFLPAKGIVVIFGGGDPRLENILWLTASSRSLGLNNTGDEISLFDANNNLIDQVIYGSKANEDQSIVRFPEGEAGGFIQHTQLPNANGRRFSAGYFVNPPPNHPIAVPECLSVYYLMTGMGLSWCLKRKATFFGPFENQKIQ